MRTNNSIKNGIVAIIMSIVTILFGFVSQRVFVSMLGTELLGLNGLYSNILSMLSIAELGFGSAIIYHLYKPISDNDYKKINILLSFYKKIYNAVALIILLLGTIVTIFIPYIVGETQILNIRFLFFLSLLEVVSSYLLTYKRSILYADQKNYILNLFHIVYIIVFNVVEIILLLISKNYILYLIIKIVCRILENLMINSYVNKKYLYLKVEKNNTLDNETLCDIKSKVKGLLFHNIGSSLVQGTDNIIISKIFGITIVGICSNYFMIVNAFNSIFNQIFQSITSSVGNLLVENDNKKFYITYKNILFINSYLYTIISACTISGMTSFIVLWMGEDFLLSDIVLIVMICSFFIQGLRKTNSVFKNAAGIFYEDKYVPLIESVINLIFSIILSLYFGLVGVFIGTIVSSLVLNLYSYPIYVYKKILNRSYLSYLIDNFKYHIIGIVIILFSFFTTKVINVNNQLLSFIISITVAFFEVNFVFLLLFYKSNELKFLKNTLFTIKNKLLNIMKKCR